MKRLFITLSFIAIANAMVAQNYDFTYGNLYYKNLGNHNIMVTYPNNSYNYYGGYTKPSGDVVIQYSLRTGHNWYDEVWYTITKIGDHAFYGCDGLASVTITDGISSIDAGAFSNCSSLTSIIIPASVSSIGDGAFSNCTSLDSINIPNTVLSIGSEMFSGCISLKSVTIPNTITIIGNNMFKDCSSLDSITIPNSVTKIGENAFSGCTNLTKITIPDSVTEIGENAFSGCTSLTRITIPDSEVRIGEGAFLNCSNLKTINIPNTVQFIGSTTFKGCDSLQYNEFDNALYLGNDENKYLWLVKAKSKDITSCIINSKCKHIADNAFSGCDKLTSINIPNSIVQIGQYAFSGSNMKCATIPKSVITIEPYAFPDNTTLYCEPDTRPENWVDSYSNYHIPYWHGNGSTIWGIKASVTDDFVFYATDTIQHQCGVYKYFGNATDVIIPSSAYFDGVEYSVTNIKSTAFNDCGLLSISIPESITEIENGAFSGNDLQYYRYDNAFYLGNEDKPYLYLVKVRSTNITSCKIHNDCQIINGGAFNSCSNLTSIEIPDKVLNIKYATFYYCSSLKTVIFGKSVKYIEDYAFNYCSSLQMAIFPNSLKSIGGYAFADCSNLKIVYIPNSVTFINGVNPSFCDSEAIIYCQDAIYNKWESGWNYKKIQGVTSPSHEVILNCFLKDSLIYQITSSEEPYTVKVCKYIGNNSSVEVPETVVSEDVEYVVTDIAENTFSDCASSITLIMKSETPPNLSNTNALQSVASIHIQCGSLNNYKSAAYWSSFSNYVEDFSYAFSVQSDDEAKGTIEIKKEPTCSENAVIQANAETGYVFYQWSDGNTANPRYLTVTQDTALVAYFVVDEVEVEIASANTAQGTVSNSSGTYHYNDEIEISATANYGYHFARWSDGVTANQRKVVLKKDTVIEAEFAVNQYTITLKTNNAALGSVSGGGTFNYLSNNEISAAANEGYVFAKWEDGNTANPRTVSLTCDTTFTAIFVPAECQLQVATSDEVKGYVSNSSGTYNYKDEVEISATANYGYHFTCWSDSVTANPRTVTITKDTVIKAEFAVNQYAITLQTNNAALGSVSGGGTFNYLSNNEISAAANEGYVFAKWEDGNTANPRTVSLTCDTTFTAVFVAAEYDLTVTSANTALGSVTGSGTIKYKEKAIISAVVTAAHYHFNGWTDGNRQNPRTVQVLSDTAFVATFAIDSFTVAATSRTEEFGAVSGGGLYAYGTAVEVKAQPQPHCHFVEWSNGAIGTVQTFNVEKDTAIAAVFAIDSHRLQVASADSAKGTVTGSGNYDYGGQITVSATAAAGCYFTGWSDGTTANPRIITIESDTTVVANFEQMLEFSITVVPSDTTRGTVSGTGKYVSGTEATLSAIPRQHYLFSQWSDGRTDNPRTVRVIADATYTAVFVPMQYNIILSQNNADMGMVSGSGVYSYGERVSCLAKPYPNYHFVQWSNGETANPYEFVIEGNQLLTAYFAAGAVTAIADDAATEPIIYAVGRTIVVENATNEILIYDAMGKLLCRDAIHRVRTEITVNIACVYIVKTGNTVMRVVVE